MYKPKGVTLIEILVVVSIVVIIGVMIASIVVIPRRAYDVAMNDKSCGAVRSAVLYSLEHVRAVQKKWSEDGYVLDKVTVDTGSPGTQVTVIYVNSQPMPIVQTTPASSKFLLVMRRSERPAESP